jgi:hypothetical protein
VFAATIATSQLLGPLALLGTGPALDTVGTTRTLLAILIVQTAAYVVFMAAGLRERFRPAAITVEQPEPTVAYRA